MVAARTASSDVHLVAGDAGDEFVLRLSGVADLAWVASGVLNVKKAGAVVATLPVTVDDAVERLVRVACSPWLDTASPDIYAGEVELVGGSVSLTFPGPREALLRIIVRSGLDVPDP